MSQMAFGSSGGDAMVRAGFSVLVLACVALTSALVDCRELLAQQVSPSGLAPQRSEKLDPRALQPMGLEHAQDADPLHLHLDAVVTDKQGKPVTDLHAQDFTVLDDGHPVALTGFAANGINSNAISTVLIVFDTVNTSLADTAYARAEVMKYLKSDGGKLSHPVALFFFNGDGAVPIGNVSTNGNSLAATLQAAGSTLHPVRRSEGFYGAEEKLDRSLRTLALLTRAAAQQPGRKLMFWLSPGWPLLVGTQAYPSQKDLDIFFRWIVLMSNGLREARVTLFDVNPVRTPDEDFVQWNYYRSYLKGVPKANKATAANLALQVLATQSGGGAINPSSKDLWQEIAGNVASYDTSYTFAFNRPQTQHPDEYHALKITVNNSDLVVHTRNAYYAEPK
jgi:VWFA-related protein